MRGRELGIRGHQLIRFVKAWLLVGVAAALFAAAPARADKPVSAVDRVVHPTGVFPDDVQNIQAAVDLGGTVLLKATDAAGRPTAFNFGSPEPPPGPATRVRLTNEVDIVGEGTGAGMTTIQGGFIPFLGNAPARTSIRNLNFEGPGLSAIIIIQSTGSEIVGNRVSGVVGTLLFFGLTEGRGIKFLGNNDPDGAITGKVVVAGNVIEDAHADLSDAIVFDAVAADVEIIGNRIETVQSSGILVIRSKGSVNIEDNYVAPGPGDSEFSAGNGISIFGSRGASYRVARNTVIAENPFADGIIFLGRESSIIGGEPLGRIDAPVIEQNRIVMTDSFFSAVTLLDDVNEAYVGRNRIEGSGALAFDVFQTFFGPDSVASSNTFVGNNISGFESSFADVSLDVHTQDTVLVGNSGTVFDRGTNNRLTGFTPMGHAQVGRQIRDANARKHDLLSHSGIAGP